MHTTDAQTFGGFDPPLVSILVSNYNYSQYLPRCVQSIVTQRYPNIECIIVDDASTDDSAHVLAEIEVAHPDFIYHRRPTNGGQSAAVLDGLARASGLFVIFLDADDVLLPDAVATHIYGRISLRFPVGLTCADMLQWGDNALVSVSCISFNLFVMTNGDQKASWRPNLIRVSADADHSTQNVLDDVYLVHPWDKGWAWTATSGMMFRRDAIALWEKTPGLAGLRYSTDAFFCYGVNAICGSALIDRPLAAYRIHGKNGFTARLPLNHVRNFDPASNGQRTVDALRLLLKQATTQRRFYQGLMWSDAQYRQMLRGFKSAITDLIRLKHEMSEEPSLTRRLTSVIVSAKDAVLYRLRSRFRRF